MGMLEDNITKISGDKFQGKIINPEFQLKLPLFPETEEEEKKFRMKVLLFEASKPK